MAFRALLGGRLPRRIPRGAGSMTVALPAAAASLASLPPSRPASRFDPTTVTGCIVTCNVACSVLQLMTGGRVTDLAMKVNELVWRQPWRLVTPALVHGSPLHLMVNTFSLSEVGPEVESVCGPRRMLTVYICSAAFGNIASVFFNPSPAVGASGAIMGLVGALGTVLALNDRAFGGRERPQLKAIGRVVAANLLMGALSPGIDNWGHLGGLLGGALTASLLGPRLRREKGRLVDSPPLPWLAGDSLLFPGSRRSHSRFR